MDRVQKFQQSEKIKKYLDDNQIFELFLNLMKQLVVNKPDKPLDFLIDKLYNPLVKRIFLMGPPGSDRKEYAKRLKDNFNMSIVETGALLRKEVAKGTDMGIEIQKAFQEFRFVPDEIVIEVVRKKIVEYEKECKHWVIEGFPRTRIQSLALEKMGIIPDKLIKLECASSASLSKIKVNMVEGNSQLKNLELDNAAKNCLLEYDLNMKGVSEIFGKFIFEIKTNDKQKYQVEGNLFKMVGLHFNKMSPRRPPSVLIIGPPGSGRGTQARQLADQFGLVYVSVRQLLKQKINDTPELGVMIKNCMDSGKLVPDHVVNNLVEARLEQHDCKVNGWILEGFPLTPGQLYQLKAMKVKPTATFLFKQDLKDSIKRLKERRLDPQNGDYYNYKLIKCEDPHLGEIIREAYRAKDKKKLESIGFGDQPSVALDTLSLNLHDGKRISLGVLNRLVICGEDKPEMVSHRVTQFNKQIAGIEEDLNDNLHTQDVTNLTVSELFEILSNKILSE